MKNITFLLFLLLSSGLLAAPNGTTTPKSINYQEALTLLNQGSQSFDGPSLSAALQFFKNNPDHGTVGLGCDYHAAQACLALTLVYDLDKDRGSAEKILTQGIQYAQRALSENPDSADTHALLGRLYEVKLLYGDMFTGMDIGPKAATENKKALVLDPKDPQVQLALGIQYVMAPPIGGGDVPKGILALKEALKLDPHMDEVYYWLAKAYRKLNKRQDFEQALRTGMALNPLDPLFQKEWDSWKP